jgi:hypothetical protein
VATAPYPLLSDALSHVRVQVNDSIVSIGGQTLTNTAAFTPYYTNRGWQMLQQELLQLGYVRLKVLNFVLAGIPASTNLDTQYQATLSWTGFSDGVVPNAGIVLPQTLIRPLELRERVSGQSPNLNPFLKMSGPNEGIATIPLIPKTYRNKIWTWANDTIQMPGTTGTIDLGMDYASYLPDFTTGSFPGNQVVPILRSTDALAWAIGYVFCYARNDEPPVCAYARDEFRRAAAIIAGANLPTQTQTAPQAVIQ